MAQPNKIRIVTRTSALAMWQANYVRAQLLSHHNQLDVEIIGVKTTGDLSQADNIPLSKIGGKAVFVKELEQALIANEADIAVHSLKDVPATFPPGLGLTTLCERASPFDAWVCPQGYTVDSIPAGSVVGTSSLRRTVQLKKLRPDLNYVPLRGNVDTRLRKCREGEYTAIVLAVAGLVRLNQGPCIVTSFSPSQVLPAVGQGALGIECRLDDNKTRELLAFLDHAPTRAAVEAERAMNAALGGNCQVPVAGFAYIENNKLCLQGKVGHPETLVVLEAYHEGEINAPQKLGEKVASDLIAQGAMAIINDIMKA
ncbi:MAG: hydroxymethylbilane synthase [Proteobacteria bacterium]|nr:hydroxymethylbilane synthase [Pseudomonadota bacterium]